MRRLTLLALLAVLMLSACAPSAQAVQTAIAETQAAGMSDLLISRRHRLLEETSTLSAMTIQGVTFEDYCLQLARAKGSYTLALSAQSPEQGIAPEVVTELNKAFTGWDLARSVWDAELHGGGAPHAPDAVRYSELVEYVGLENLPFVGGVPGEGDVDSDQAVRKLMGMATDHFGTAQYLLLDQMR